MLMRGTKLTQCVALLGALMGMLAQPAMSQFELMDLPYDDDALEPYISSEVSLLGGMVSGSRSIGQWKESGDIVPTITDLQRRAGIFIPFGESRCKMYDAFCPWGPRPQEYSLCGSVRFAGSPYAGTGWTLPGVSHVHRYTGDTCSLCHKRQTAKS